MKWTTLFRALLAALVFTLAAASGQSAVLMTYPSDGEYGELLSTSTIAWEIRLEAGSLSSPVFTSEVTVTANGVQYLDHLWSRPEQITISYDVSGNLNVQTGALMTIVQPVQGFNAVLIRVGDQSFFGPTEFKAGTFDGLSIRDMQADDLDTFIWDYDNALFSNVGDTFVLNGALFMNETSVLDQSHMTITGINVSSSIPEPSSALMTASMLVVALFWRKR